MRGQDGFERGQGAARAQSYAEVSGLIPAGAEVVHRTSQRVSRQPRGALSAALEECFGVRQLHGLGGMIRLLGSANARVADLDSPALDDPR